MPIHYYLCRQLKGGGMEIYMIDFFDVLELEKLLSKMQEKNAESSMEDMAVNLVTGLIAGQKNSMEWRNNFQNFCHISPACGMYLAEKRSDDEIVLKQILEACDQTTLKSIASKYGKNSKIGAIVEKFCSTPKHPSLENELKANHESFYQLLVKQMEKEGYKTDADYYNKLCFSRQTFSKLRNPDYNVSRENAIWLTMGLTPNYQDGTRLLGAAGYSFRENKRRENIMIYVMKKGRYTLYELNELLSYFGEIPVGCEG